ncbi:MULTISPECIES: MucBP domain-containing protein, partial [unclassified Lactococcus]|uniref:MucBP domain-containing protein n=1 Tax=unclassified Lactococcus TaxID=2643510 RepID=UPI0011C93E86
MSKKTTALLSLMIIIFGSFSPPIAYASSVGNISEEQIEDSNYSPDSKNEEELLDKEKEIGKEAVSSSSNIKIKEEAQSPRASNESIDFVAQEEGAFYVSSSYTVSTGQVSGSSDTILSGGTVLFKNTLEKEFTDSDEYIMKISVPADDFSSIRLNSINNDYNGGINISNEDGYIVARLNLKNFSNSISENAIFELSTKKFVLSGGKISVIKTEILDKAQNLISEDDSVLKIQSEVNVTSSIEDGSSNTEFIIGDEDKNNPNHTGTGSLNSYALNIGTSWMTNGQQLGVYQAPVQVTVYYGPYGEASPSTNSGWTIDSENKTATKIVSIEDLLKSNGSVSNKLNLTFPNVENQSKAQFKAVATPVENGVSNHDKDSVSLLNKTLIVAKPTLDIKDPITKTASKPVRMLSNMSSDNEESMSYTSLTELYPTSAKQIKNITETWNMPVGSILSQTYKFYLPTNISEQYRELYSNLVIKAYDGDTGEELGNVIIGEDFVVGGDVNKIRFDFIEPIKSISTSASDVRSLMLAVKRIGTESSKDSILKKIDANHQEGYGATSNTTLTNTVTAKLSTNNNDTSVQVSKDVATIFMPFMMFGVTSIPSQDWNASFTTRATYRFNLMGTGYGPSLPSGATAKFKNLKFYIQIPDDVEYTGNSGSVKGKAYKNYKGTGYTFIKFDIGDFDFLYNSENPYKFDAEVIGNVNFKLDEFKLSSFKMNRWFAWDNTEDVRAITAFYQYDITSKSNKDIYDLNSNGSTSDLISLRESTVSVTQPSGVYYTTYINSQPTTNISVKDGQIVNYIVNKRIIGNVEKDLSPTVIPIPKKDISGNDISLNLNALIKETNDYSIQYEINSSKEFTSESPQDLSTVTAVKFIPKDGSSNNINYIIPLKVNGIDLNKAQKSTIKPYRITTTNVSLSIGSLSIRNEGTLDSASVTVKHVDEAGKEIADATTSAGYVGHAYTTAPVKVDGYVLKETPVNATGKYSDDEQIVT